MEHTVASRIKELRLEYGLSQAQFGKQLSVSQDTVSLWENGKSIPTIEYVIAICKIFGISADFLLGLCDF